MGPTNAARRSAIGLVGVRNDHTILANRSQAEAIASCSASFRRCSGTGVGARFFQYGADVRSASVQQYARVSADDVTSPGAPALASLVLTQPGRRRPTLSSVAAGPRLGQGRHRRLCCRRTPASAPAGGPVRQASVGRSSPCPSRAKAGDPAGSPPAGESRGEEPRRSRRRWSQAHRPSPVCCSLRRSTRGLERSQLFGVNLRPGEPGSPPAGPPRRRPLDLHARVCRD